MIKQDFKVKIPKSWDKKIRRKAEVVGATGPYFIGLMLEKVLLTDPVDVPDLVENTPQDYVTLASWISLRIPVNAAKYVRQISKEHGWSVAHILRQVMNYWIRTDESR